MKSRSILSLTLLILMLTSALILSAMSKPFSYFNTEDDISVLQEIKVCQWAGRWKEIYKYVFQYNPIVIHKPELAILERYNKMYDPETWTLFEDIRFTYGTNRLISSFTSVPVDDYPYVEHGEITYDSENRVTDFNYSMGYSNDYTIDITIDYLSEYEFELHLSKTYEEGSEERSVQMELDSQNRIKYFYAQSHQVIDGEFAVDREYKTEYIYYPNDETDSRDYIRHLSENIYNIIFLDGERNCGKIKEIIDYSLDDNEIWLPYFKEEYIYSDSSQLIYKNKYYYDSGYHHIVLNTLNDDDFWQENYRHIYEYDDNGNLIRDIWQSFIIAQNEFLNYKLKEYSYGNITEIEDASSPALPSISLSMYPQPFKDEINIFAESKTVDAIDIDIFNLRGQKLKSFVGFSGKNCVWDGRDESGRALPASIYFLRAKQGDDSILRKIIKTK